MSDKFRGHLLKPVRHRAEGENFIIFFGGTRTYMTVNRDTLRIITMLAEKPKQAVVQVTASHWGLTWDEAEDIVRSVEARMPALRHDGS